MPSSGRRHVVAAVLVCTAIALAGPGGPAVAEPPQPGVPADVLADERRRPLPTEPLRLADVAESVQYLKATYGVGEAEAMRRMELQRRSPELAARLAARHSDVYAGLSIDQDGGGALVVRATDPARLTAALAADTAWRGPAPSDAGRLRVERARWSLHDLQAEATRLTKALDAGPGKPVAVFVDQAANRVVVQHVDKPSAAATGRAQAAVGARPGMATVETWQPEEPKASYPQSYCNPMMCDPPMRGGVRLDIQREDGSWGGCTSGFNVIGSNGWVYVLTAGHCVLNERHDEIVDRPFHNGLPVGSEASGRVGIWRPPVDFALIPFETFGDNWAHYWVYDRFGKNRVARFGPDNNNASDCSPGSGAFPGYSCPFQTTWIAGTQHWLDVVNGSVLCATGTATGVTSADRGGSSDAPAAWMPGTRCGTASSASLYDIYVSNLCSALGDSGGPLWNQTSSAAVGILRDGPPARDNNTCGSTPHSRYLPVSTAFQLANGESGLTFRVMDNRDG
jgi:streptogrisin C